MKRVWLIIISVILLAGVCWAADKPVSQLPATENIKNEDLFLVSQYNAGNYFSRHITFANLKKKLDELYQAIGGGGGGGYTNLTQFTEQTPWRLFYSDGTGDVKELAFGGNGQYLKSNGAAVAPSWDAPAVGGDFNEAGNYTPTGDWDWSGVGLGSKWPTFNQDTTGNAATATDLKDYGNLYTGTVTGGALQKYDAATKKLTDGLKLGTLTDGKWCTYSTNNGLVCNSSEPVGGGGMVYPSAGIPVSTGEAWSDAATASTITGLWKTGEGVCSGYLKSDGTCDTPSSGISLDDIYSGTVTDGAIPKYVSATKTLTDGLKLGTLTDTKWCTYSSESGIVCNSDKPAEGIAVSDIYTGTINDGDLTKYDQSTGKLKSAGAAAGYTEPQSNLPICRTGAGTVGACTNLTDKTIPTYTEPASNLPLCRTGSGTWGACSNLTDAAIPATGTMTDGKWCVYSSASGIVCNSDEPSGGGGNGIDYTPPEDPTPLCSDASGAIVACTHLKDDDFAEMEGTPDDVGVKIVMVTGDPDEVIECEGRDRTYVIGANANYFFQLPADPSGIKYCFANGAYETVISIVPDGTDVIRFIGDTTGEGDGLVSTGAYQDYVCLLGLNTSTWRVIQTMGTWAIDEVELPSEEEEPPNGNGCVTPTGTLFTESFGEGDQSCWSAGPSTCNNTWTVVSGTYAIDSSPAGAPENTACDNSMLMSRTDASQNIRADLGAGALTDVDTTINFTMYIDSTTITEWGDLSFFGVTTGSSFFDGLQYVVLLERQAPGGGAATRIGVMSVAENGTCYIDNIEENTWYNVVLTVDGEGGENASSLSIGSGAGQSCSLTLPPAGRYLWFVLNNHAADIYIGNVRVSTSGGN